MTYHTRMLLQLVPGALTIAFIVWLWLWAFEVLEVILTTLHQGVTP